MSYLFKTTVMSLWLMAIQGAITGYGKDVIIGDFETSDSFKCNWIAPAGTWAVPGKSAQSEFHATRGRFSIEITFAGSQVNSYPYFEYAFPKNAQDLTIYKKMSMDIFNPSEKKYRVQGYFLMSAKDNADKKVRFWLDFSIFPGKNTFTVDLNGKDGRWERDSKIVLAPDWSKVIKVLFFYNCPREDVKLFVDNILLNNGELKNDDATDKVIEASTPAPKPVAVQFKTAPIINGKLDDQVWESAQAFELAGNNSGKRVTNKTVVKIGYDNSNLYFGFFCPNEKGVKAKSPVRVHDGTIWNDDNIEIFLQNAPNSYYQFMFNGAGSKFDAMACPPNIESLWNPEWTVVTIDNEDGWSAEAALPWNIFHFDPAFNQEWKMNIFHFSSSTKENSALSPTGGSYHMPGKFIAIKLPAPNTDIFSINIDSFALPILKIGDNLAAAGIYSRKTDNYDFELEILNNGDKRTKNQTIKLKAGNQSIKLPFIVEQGGDCAIRLNCKTSSGKTIASSNQLIVPMTPPLEIVLKTPFYRQNIYAGQVCPSTEGIVSVNIEPNSLGKSKLKLEIIDSEGKVIGNQETIGSEIVPFNMDIAKIKDGIYTITATLSIDGQVSVTKNTVFNKLPQATSQVTIGEDRLLYIDGKPHFSLMMYPGATPRDYPDLRKNGINTLYYYSGWRAPDKELAIYEEMDKQGFKVIPSFAASIVEAGPDRSADPETAKKRLQPFVEKAMQSKAVIGYNILDEPNIIYKSYHKPYGEVYEYLKQIDPYRAVHIVSCGELNLPVDHHRICDIYEFDYYPGFKLDGECLQPLSVSAQKVKALNAALPKSKSIWVLFQGYDRARELDKFATGRLPDYQETRSLFYSCYAEGASSLGFWCFANGGFGSMAGRWEMQGIYSVYKEFDNMMEVIVSPDAKAQLACAGGDEQKFHLRLKNRQGYLYIIGASTDEEPKKITFSGDVLKNITKLSVLGENRKILIGNNAFSDDFAKYGVHVYTNDPNPPKIVPIAENQQLALSSKTDWVNRNSKNILHQLLLKNNYSIKVAGPNSTSVTNFMFDGMRNSKWSISAKDMTAPLEVLFTQSQMMNRIVVLSSNNYLHQLKDNTIKNFELKIKVDGNWRLLKSFTDNTNIRLEVKFPEAKVSAIGLFWGKNNPPSVQIDEIEAYLD